MLNVIAIHGILMEVNHPCPKCLRCDLQEPLIMRQLGVPSMAEVTVYHKAIVIANYHTLSKQPCGKSSITRVLMSNQDLSQIHSLYSTCYRK